MLLKACVSEQDYRRILPVSWVKITAFGALQQQKLSYVAVEKI